MAPPVNRMSGDVILYECGGWNLPRYHGTLQPAVVYRDASIWERYFDAACERAEAKLGRKAEVLGRYFVQIGPKKSLEDARLQLKIAVLEASIVHCHETIAELCDERAELIERISALETRLLPAPAPQLQDADPCLAEVLEFTQEMFGSVEVALERDPESPEAPYVVFTVRPTGTIEQLVEMRIDWHNALSNVRPRNSGNFRLSIVPQT